MGTLSKKVLIKYRVDTRQAIKGQEALAKGSQRVAVKSDEAAQALKRFDQASARASKNSAMVSKIMREASGSSSGLGSSLSGLASSMGGPGGIIAAAAGAGFAVSELKDKVTELADRSLQVSAVFDNVPISIEAARRSTRGLVTDFDLARLAADSVSLGVTDSAKTFSELSSSLQRLGARRGIDSLKSIQDGLSGIGRRETELLDNLGIVLKISDAEKEYAASLNKTTKELTDAERAAAFREVATRKVIDAARGVTLDTDNAAAAVRRFNVELQNIEDRALGGSVAGTSLAQALQEISADKTIDVQGLKDYRVNVAELRDELRDLGVAADDIPSSLQALAKAAKAANTDVRILRGEEELRRRAQAKDPAFIAAQKQAEAEKASLETARARVLEIEDEQALLSFNNQAIAQKAELQIESLRLQARIVRATGDEAKARQIERQAELAQIAELSRIANLKGRRRGRRRDPFKDERLEFQQQLTEAINAERLREFSQATSLQRGYLADVKRFESELAAARMPNIDRFEAEKKRAEFMAEFETNAAQRKLELDLAQAASDQARSQIRQEAFSAREAQLAREIQLETNLDERKRLQDERDQVRHESTMARIEAEQAAREAYANKVRDTFKIVDSVTASSFQLGTTINAAAVKDGERRKKIEDGIQAASLVTKGAVAQAEAIIAFARYDFVQGAALQGAAINAFAQAGIIASGGGGRGRSGGGSSITTGSATQFGGGGGPAPTAFAVDRGGPLSVREDVEGNPNNTSNQSSSSARVVNINAPIQVLGAIDREAAKKIKQGLGEIDGRV